MNFPSHDKRTGLGYGVHTDRFHKPRKLSSTYPYVQPDPYSDAEDEIDEEDEEAVSSKVNHRTVSDFGASGSTDSFYFVSGNTKLSDCFFHTDQVLIEVEALGDSMSPIPNLYKGSKIGMGSSKYATTGNFLRTGDTHGWSKSPRPHEEDEDEIEIYSLEDLAAYLELSP